MAAPGPLSRQRVRLHFRSARNPPRAHLFRPPGGPSRPLRVPGHSRLPVAPLAPPGASQQRHRTPRPRGPAARCPAARALRVPRAPGRPLPSPFPALPTAGRGCSSRSAPAGGARATPPPLGGGARTGRGTGSCAGSGTGSGAGRAGPGRVAGAVSAAAFWAGGAPELSPRSGPVLWPGAPRHCDPRPVGSSGPGTHRIKTTETKNGSVSYSP